MTANTSRALTRRSGLPGRVIADPLGLRDKVGQGTGVERGLVQRAALEQLATGRLEVAVQRRKELQGCTESVQAVRARVRTLVREDLLVSALDLGRDLARQRRAHSQRRRPLHQRGGPTS